MRKITKKNLTGAKVLLVAGVGAAVTCPMCQGCGTIKNPHLQQKNMKEKELTAKLMRRQGYSIREIMRAMKYKSPRCVAQLLNK